MRIEFMMFRPFAPDMEVRLSCRKGIYHLNIVCYQDGRLQTLHDMDHDKPSSVVDSFTTLIYSRSSPNIGVVSRLVYGMLYHPALALHEFRGISIEAHGLKRDQRNTG